MVRNIEDVLKEFDLLAKRTNKIDLPSDQLIKNYQNSLKITFPDDYVLFLKRENNAYFGTKEPFVVTEDGNLALDLKEGVKGARQLGLPHNILPFCEDNGDYYCFFENGEVKFWSHNGGTKEKWDSLADWIKEVWIDEEAS
jgi:hypothetical protein